MRSMSSPSTPAQAPAKRRGARLLAALVATAIATLGVTAVATPAHAAGPTVSAQEIPAAGGTITLTGSGFTPSTQGIYLGVGPTGLPGFYLGASSLISSETIWIAPGNVDGTSPSGRTAPMNADGTFSVTVTVPAASASIPTYAVYTSKGHGQGMSDTSQNSITPLAYAPVPPATTTLALASSAASVTDGSPVTLTATVSPAAAGTVTFREGSATLGTGTVSGSAATFSTSGLAVGAHAITAAFAPADSSAFAASTASAVTVTVTAVGAPTPASVTVAPATGLDPAGASITVTGANFAQTGGAVPGVYVGVGPKSAVGEPSWNLTASLFQGVAWVRTIGADGAFTSTLTGIAQVFTSNGRQVDCSTEECGVYTFAAHGSADRTQDTYTPIAFAVPAVTPVATTLTITTSSASSTSGSGVDVTVAVSPKADGTVSILDGSTVVARNLVLRDGAATTRISTLPQGSRSLTATFTPADPSAFAPSTAAPVSHTVTAPPIVTVPTVPDPVVVATPTAPAEPVCVARSISDATLSWGLKSSFRNYISGGIANGSWSLSGVTYADGKYGWSNGSGSYNTADDKGIARFPGSVAFSGHNGVLNLVLSNVAVKVTGPNTATIVADVHSTDMGGAASDHSGIAFASVALSGGASGSRVTATDAPATLTAAGATAFAGFYDAGTALDPVSFSLPLGATVPCDSATAANLATTGGGDAGNWPLLGGLMILVGVAAVVAVRRRASTRAAAQA
ncbi:HtaA domain-containing protein [Leifsonia lichenia]